MLWLLKYWKLGIVAALILGYIPLGMYYYAKGKNVEFQACEKAKFEAFQQGAGSRKEIDVKVKRLSASDVDKLLKSNEWMRTH